MAPAEGAPGATAARCAAHPEALAGGSCPRCGGFFCEDCASPVLGVLYCAACAARPEVNYLERFRLRVWGRRDGLAWLLGAWGLVTLAPGVALLGSGEGLDGGLVLASSAVGVGCFFRQRWARVGLLVLPLGLGVVGWVREGPAGLPLALLVLVVALSIHQDGRHRLFFRLPVPPDILRRLWDRYENNPLAMHALSFGVVGLLVPVFAPLALLCGGLALRRVDPEARPPIGRKGQALGALALGLGSLLLWAGLLRGLYLGG